MKLLTLLGLVLFSACATYQPPAKPKIDNSKTFSLSYDDTWKKIVSYATKNGMNIKTIDKSSGLIAFEKSYDDAASTMYLSCGNVQELSPLAQPVYSPITLNITVVKNSEVSTDVNVNLFGRISFPSALKEYQCYSNGSFEKELFCEIDGHPCQAPIPTPTPKQGAKQF